MGPRDRAPDRRDSREDRDTRGNPDKRGDESRASARDTVLLIVLALRLILPILAAIIGTVLLAYGLFVISFR